MLNKIENISSGSEFSKASRPMGFSGGIASAYVRQTYAHDSVNISPALQFLNLVRWKLKEFKHIAKEKLFLDFVLSDIEFQTTIDLISIESADDLNYHVIKEGNQLNYNGKIISDISVNIDNTEYGKDLELINLSALNVFFQRIFNQKNFNELNQNDQYLIEEIINGISAGIEEEFEYLNNQLFIFLEKLEGIRIDKKDIRKLNKSKIVNVKSIRLINAK